MLISSLCLFSIFSYSLSVLYCSGAHRDLHSFPTRRSSDLPSPQVDFPEGQKPASGLLAETSLQDPDEALAQARSEAHAATDRKSTRLNSSHVAISYAVFCLKKKKNKYRQKKNKKQNHKTVH